MHVFLIRMLLVVDCGAIRIWTNSREPLYITPLEYLESDHSEKPEQ